MSSWGVSDFFAVDNAPSSRENKPASVISTATASSSNSFRASSDLKNGNHVSPNNNLRAETVRARGVKRKQLASASQTASRDSGGKLDLSSSGQSKFTRQASFSKHPSFENSRSSCSSTAISSRGQLWAEKHAPTTSDQLSVHPKKVQEVRQWLESYYSQRDDRVVSPFLLLTGPAGGWASGVALVLG